MAIRFTGATEREDLRSSDSEQKLYHYLRDISASTKQAIRLYYTANCAKTSPVDYSLPFPALKIHAPNSEASGAAIHEIFATDERVKIHEQPPDMVRIWVGKVPTEFLQTRISFVTFTDGARHNPDLAIAAIMSTNEVVAAMHSRRLTLSPNVGGLETTLPEVVPSLPKSLSNLSLDEALDAIARTWGGPVVYGICTRPTGESGNTLVWVAYNGYTAASPF